MRVCGVSGLGCRAATRQCRCLTLHARALTPSPLLPAGAPHGAVSARAHCCRLGQLDDTYVCKLERSGSRTPQTGIAPPKGIVAVEMTPSFTPTKPASIACQHTMRVSVATGARLYMWHLERVGERDRGRAFEIGTRCGVSLLRVWSVRSDLRNAPRSAQIAREDIRRKP